MDASEKKQIRLGTRGSQLAMWQSGWVKNELEKLGHRVELIQIKTQGDVQTGSLSQIGGQGLFTKQLQVALHENRIDLAVHSLKDLPTEDAPGLTIAAVPRRETTRDVLCLPGPNSKLDSLDGLKQGAVVGTGSVRRAAQLLNLRPDLQIRDIRGNVDTRLEKLESGQYDAILLAAAGLTRLGLKDRISYPFEPQDLLPAVGQGALGLETRADDDSTRAAVSALNHSESFSAALAERAMLRRLFAGCLAPVGARCTVEASRLKLSGVVLSRDGKARVEAGDESALEDFESLGVSVAEKLLAQGAGELLTSARADA